MRQRIDNLKIKMLILKKERAFKKGDWHAYMDAIFEIMALESK